MPNDRYADNFTSDALTALRSELSESELDSAEIFRLGQKIAEFSEAHASSLNGRFPTQRIAVAGSVTTEFLARSIACAVLGEGVLPLVYQAPFGAYVQEVLDRDSGLHRFRPEVVLIAPNWRDVADDLPIDSPPEKITEAVEEKVQLFRQLWSAIGRDIGSRIMQHVLIPPVRHFCGVAERLSAASAENQVLAATRMLLEMGRGRVFWVELDRLAARNGVFSFSDEGSYAAAKLPFNLKFLPDYLAAFGGAWRSCSGRSKKVLVLDLDNTLWGGVIGDDGLDGILLGPGSPAGEAFFTWQTYLKQLSGRGVALAVCSKNDPQIAASGFGHPHSVLKRSDFAAFQCSWSDKAAGLRQLANALNVGAESLVFADDNPAECEQVRRALPNVAVVHLGEDPARFIEILERFQWFDLPEYTGEDLGRGAAYAARAKALDERRAAGDLSAYLAGLRMVASLTEAQPRDLSRLSQLEQKTNQFNLTTRRYTEDEIASFMRREDALVLSLHLSDKFGDHGLVSSLIAIQEGDTLRIDSWLMSCRVFSRTVEEFTMGHLAKIARSRGLSQVVGEYRPTARNQVTSSLFERLGFSRTPGEGMFWSLHVPDRAPSPKLRHFIAAAPQLREAPSLADR